MIEARSGQEAGDPAKAAKVILELEDWLPRYTERNASGQVSPQSWIAVSAARWSVSATEILAMEISLRA